jgi:ATP-dependent helicase/DNAse subunit B
MGPPASGKTKILAQLARSRGKELFAKVAVCLPSSLHVEAWKRILAAQGGAIGVDLMTFDDLVDTMLINSGNPCFRLQSGQAFTVLRQAVRMSRLSEYESIGATGGFIRGVSRAIDDFRAAMISPRQLKSIEKSNLQLAGLADIAKIYTSYMELLEKRKWRDSLETQRLVLEIVVGDFTISNSHGMVIFDGFDAFTPLQRNIIKSLKSKEKDIALSMTAPMNCHADHSSFERYCRIVNETLNAIAPDVNVKQLLSSGLVNFTEGINTGDINFVMTPVDGIITEPMIPGLIYLNRNLTSMSIDCRPEIVMIEAVDKGGEVREALRQLKIRAMDGQSLSRMAIVARDTGSYRRHVMSIAGEMGIPCRFEEGIPLRESPLAIAILRFMNLFTPLEISGESHFRFDLTDFIQTLSSPYFVLRDSVIDMNSIASAFKTAALWGNITGGLHQWREVLTLLSNHCGGNPSELSAVVQLDSSDSATFVTSAVNETAIENAVESDIESGVESDMDELSLPADVPHGEEARLLLDFIENFITEFAPPEISDSSSLQSDSLISSAKSPSAESAGNSVFCGWLERILFSENQGDDSPAMQSIHETLESFDVLHSSDIHYDQKSFQADVEVLCCFSRALQDLRWAEQNFQVLPVSFGEFAETLNSVVELTTYADSHSIDERIIVTNIQRIRGISFDTLVLLGLAEGEFPRSQKDDPLMPDHIRGILREVSSGAIDLNPVLESRESELFLETLSRSSKTLILSRPLYSESGDTWEPSPFWETLKSSGLESEIMCDPFSLKRPASRMEALISAADSALSKSMSTSAASSGSNAVAESGAFTAGAACENFADSSAELKESWLLLQRAARVLNSRNGLVQGTFNGYLADLDRRLLRGTWKAAFGPSSLETYMECPFRYYLERVLGLSVTEEPEEGLNALSEGSILHEILRLSIEPELVNPSSERVMQACQRVLNTAPVKYGFRPPPWWKQIKFRLQAIAIRAAMTIPVSLGGSEPIAVEAPFGMGAGTDAETLKLEFEGVKFAIRGVVDRIDRLPDGSLAIIDYKSASSTRYTPGHFERGARLQVPLYALAVHETMGLGDVSDGIYWHFREGRKSPGTLSKIGVENGCNIAVESAGRCVKGILNGYFEPLQPPGGCPDYCPGASFCWSYKASSR